MDLSPERVAELPVEALPGALAEASAVVAAIAARLAQAPAQAPQEPEDRLLDVEEAGKVLGVSRDVLYSSPALKALRVRVGGRVLFSARRIQSYISRASGR